MAYGENAASGSSMGSSDYYAKDAAVQQIQAQRASHMNGSEPKRQPELPQSLERLAKTVEYLAQTVSELEGRLSPVLGPEPPQPGAISGGLAHGAPGTAYAGVIHENTARVHRLAQRLQDMRQRLEV